MQITLTNVSPDQLEGLKNNFGELAITEAENTGKVDVTIDIKTELECWKLFFSGADYTLARFGKTSIK